MLRNKLHHIFDGMTQVVGFVAVILKIPISPIVLRIRITHQCNLSCRFCYQVEREEKADLKPLSINEWMAIIDKLPRYTIVDITGGEPFTSPVLFELLSYLLQKKFRVSLITNGTIKDERILQLIAQYGLAYFMVSLDGFSETHNQLRGRSELYEKTVATLESLNNWKKKYNSKKPSICIKTMLLNENIAELPSFIEYCVQSLGADQLTLNIPFLNYARGGMPRIKDLKDPRLYSGNQWNYMQDEIGYKNFFSEIRKLMKKLNATINFRPGVDMGQLMSASITGSKLWPMRCFRFRSVLTIDSFGDLSPCDLCLDVVNIRDIDFSLKKFGTIARIKELTKLFKKNNYSLPACEGCCLTGHKGG